MKSDDDRGKNYEDGTSSGVNKYFEDDYGYEYEQDVKFLSDHLLHPNTNGFVDPLIQLPQVPMIGMQRPGTGVVAQPQPQLQNGYVESVVHERVKSVKIAWNHAGNNVAIIGSWDNWDTTEALQSVGQNFVIVKTLPVGIYHYRFIVDGYLTHAPEFSSAFDDSGFAYNILDLQDYVPEVLERLSDLEDPPSPPSSYDNILFLNEDEFSKPPPELPAQIPVTINHDPSSSTSSTSNRVVPRPTDLELNHLYIHKTDRDQFVALRSTNRFQHKYVTMLLYRSLRRERR